MKSYEDIIAAKAYAPTYAGIRDVDIAPHLFPFQADLTRWALRRGRAAIFADTGLGKMVILLEWARHVSAHGRVIILAPLAVGQQIARGAVRFGVAAEYARHDTGAQIVITNYEMLHRFDASDFVGVVLDESSILKSYEGKTRNALIEAFAGAPFKLACTATPAPNDHAELGNHSEFLGLNSRVEMLSEFFVHDGGSTQNWRLKGHAVEAFWKWLATWGAVVKLPSDLGYPNGDFLLPELRMHEHVLAPLDHDPAAAGTLFALDAMTLQEQRAVRRQTLAMRVAEAARIASDGKPCIVWCELNDEADAAEGAIDGAIQVAGKDTVEVKEHRLDGFSTGAHRVLVSKASICGWGLNWQHCRRQIFIGASHSYESVYQAIRRSWRFGQTEPVDIHIIRAATDGAVIENFRRKEAAAKKMGDEMTAHVGAAVRAEVQGLAREQNPYEPAVPIRLPTWIRSECA